jgi:1,4-alpha-glucan branching enzyme
MGNCGAVQATPVAAHGHYHSLNLTLPPLAIIVFRSKTND